MEDWIGRVVEMAVAAVVGMALLVLFVIPTTLDLIGQLSGDGEQYAPLLGLVIVMCVIGLIVAVIRYFQR